MSDDLSTGIPNSDQPGHWLVPPWPATASFSDVVQQFVRFHPWDNTNTAHLLAYFEGFQAALEAAPTEDLSCPARRRWYADMRDSVGRCARLYREKRTTEIQRAKGNVSTLQTVARATHSMPALQEKAS